MVKNQKSRRVRLLFGIDPESDQHQVCFPGNKIAEAVVVYGFSTLGFSRIQASTDAENVASVRVLETVGFVPMKRAVKGEIDTRFYELDRRQAKLVKKFIESMSRLITWFLNIIFTLLVILSTTNKEIKMNKKMNTVTSPDGTKIAYWKSGTGPPLLLVHGATADHSTTWRFVLPELEKHFTVYAMDRRGRGGSGDSQEYELRREAEDIAAIIDSIGEPVYVIGHSYGALCAIEASLFTGNINKMILYEGVPLNGAGLYRPGVLDKLENLLEAGDFERMLYVLFKDIVEMPQDEIEVVRAQKDAWAVRLANVSTLPRELRTETGYRFDPERFKNMQTPTLLLVGGDSPPREITHARGVADALPFGHMSIMTGQQHAAMYSAPEMFVSEVVQFLLIKIIDG